jgi:hypothetical protein
LLTTKLKEFNVNIVKTDVNLVKGTTTIGNAGSNVAKRVFIHYKPGGVV